MQELVEQLKTELNQLESLNELGFESYNDLMKNNDLQMAFHRVINYYNQKFNK